MGKQTEELGGCIPAEGPRRDLATSLGVSQYRLTVARLIRVVAQQVFPRTWRTVLVRISMGHNERAPSSPR